MFYLFPLIKAGTSKKSVELTEELKTDSVLSPCKHRAKQNLRESQRICRCAQVKLLKQKTLEKIRQSFQSDSSEQSEMPQVTKKEMSVKVTSDAAQDFNLSENEGDYGQQLQESAEFITLPPTYDSVITKKELENSAGSSKRSSREERYSQLIDNDIIGGIEMVIKASKLGELKQLPQ